jgi:hypothetical protein
VYWNIEKPVCEHVKKTNYYSPGWVFRRPITPSERGEGKGRGGKVEGEGEGRGGEGRGLDVKGLLPSEMHAWKEKVSIRHKWEMPCVGN